MPEGASTKVAVRCRPLTTAEKNNGATRIVKFSGDKVSLHNSISSGSIKESNFGFDHCYTWESKTKDLYEDLAAPMLKRALEGYNISFVAYGQSGSGKSNSLLGTIEDPGLVTMVTQSLFTVIDETSNKDFFVTVSFLEVSDEYVHDLINPSGRDLKVRQHPQLGLYVDDMAEVVVDSSEDAIRLFDQGNRILNLTSNNSSDASRVSLILTLSVEQIGAGSVKGLRSTISFFDLAASDHTSKSEESSFKSTSLNHLMQVVATLNQGTKNNSIPYRDCRLTKLLQDAFAGNSYLTFINHISPADADFSETFSSLKFTSAVKNIKNTVKRNENDSSGVIKELREEIGRLRERLSEKSNSMIDMPDTDDVTRMEELLRDLQLAKMQTWEEKQRISEMFLEERKHHLSSKGILDWVLDCMKKDGKKMQSKMENLQKDKERLMLEYKDKRKIVDDLKEALQREIMEYTKLTEAGKGNEEEGKRKVSQIHEMKEKLKKENDSLKKLKQNLKDVQEKQKNEKEEAKTQSSALKGNMELRFKLEAEQRDKMEKENQQTLADEIDRIKIETDQEKTELKARKAETKSSVDDMVKVEMNLLDLKAEKSAMAIKLRSMEHEKKQVVKDLNELYKRQKEEMEIQQLQHFQTFRHYREAFEEQKAALEQRYRSLLEDSIQDAVYLSSRNQDLSDENQNLKQELAEMKDKLSMMSGRPTSPD